MGTNIQFAILFDAQEAAERAAGALRSHGYRVDLQIPVSGQVVVDAVGNVEGSADLDAALLLMQSVADQFGGAFMGHGGLTSFPASFPAEN